MSECLNAKIVIVGDGAIGKTCVMIRYTDGYFNAEYTPTIFENKVKYINLNNRIVNLNLWDTAGQEAYSQLRSIAYPNTDVFLIAFSVVEEASFINAKKTWYRQVKNQVPNARMIFVGTKSDLRQSNPLALSFAQLKKNLRDELNCDYYECSSITGQGIDEIFNQATKLALVKQGIMNNPDIKQNNSRSNHVPKKEQPIKEESGCYCTVM